MTKRKIKKNENVFSHGNISDLEKIRHYLYSISNNDNSIEEEINNVIKSLINVNSSLSEEIVVMGIKCIKNTEYLYGHVWTGKSGKERLKITKNTDGDTFYIGYYIFISEEINNSILNNIDDDEYEYDESDLYDVIWCSSSSLNSDEVLLKLNESLKETINLKKLNIKKEKIKLITKLETENALNEQRNK